MVELFKTLYYSLHTYSMFRVSRLFITFVHSTNLFHPQDFPSTILDLALKDYKLVILLYHIIK